MTKVLNIQNKNLKGNEHQVLKNSDIFAILPGIFTTYCTSKKQFVFTIYCIYMLYVFHIYKVHKALIFRYIDSI